MKSHKKITFNQTENLNRKFSLVVISCHC